LVGVGGEKQKKNSYSGVQTVNFTPHITFISAVTPSEKVQLTKRAFQ